MWMDTLGGPFVLLPEALTKTWNRADRVTRSRKSFDDYDRVCEVSSTYVEVIELRGEWVVVFGDALLMTRPVRFRDRVYIIRWAFGRSEIDERLTISVLKVMESLRYNFDPPRRVCLAGPHYLIDAALYGPLRNIRPKAARLTFAPGFYSIEMAKYTPCNETEFLVHRFTPTS